jgi:hypothetical protein
VGFGFGSHMCAGMHMARQEIRCVAEAMIAQVVNIEVGQPEHIVHTTVRALGRLSASVQYLSVNSDFYNEGPVSRDVLVIAFHYQTNETVILLISQ